ncbi:hypothetical protein ACMZ49_20065, partial [Alcaligenes phenolicus]
RIKETGWAIDEKSFQIDPDQCKIFCNKMRPDGSQYVLMPMTQALCSGPCKPRESTTYNNGKARSGGALRYHGPGK